MSLQASEKWTECKELQISAHRMDLTFSSSFSASCPHYHPKPASAASLLALTKVASSSIRTALDLICWILNLFKKSQTLRAINTPHVYLFIKIFISPLFSWSKATLNNKALEQNPLGAISHKTSFTHTHNSNRMQLKSQQTEGYIHSYYPDPFSKDCDLQLSPFYAKTMSSMELPKSLLQSVRRPDNSQKSTNHPDN